MNGWKANTAFYDFTSIVIQLKGKLFTQASSLCLGNLCY